MGKLVRDNIPAIIRASGRSARVRELDEQAYMGALHEKLIEEIAELRMSDSANAVAEEAADVLEVLISLAALYGHSLDDILRVAQQKRADRGGFQRRLWLE